VMIGSTRVRQAAAAWSRRSPRHCAHWPRRLMAEPFLMAAGTPRCPLAGLRHLFRAAAVCSRVLRLLLLIRMTVTDGAPAVCGINLHVLCLYFLHRFAQPIDESRELIRVVAFIFFCKRNICLDNKDVIQVQICRSEACAYDHL